jgi:hypothetical protein
MKILVIGHSHLVALKDAALDLILPEDADLQFMLLRLPEFWVSAPGRTDPERKSAASFVSGIDKAAVSSRIARVGADVAALCTNGNEHTALGMIASDSVSRAAKLMRIRKMVADRLPAWLDFLMPLLPPRVLFFTSPPPLGEASFKGEHAEKFASRLGGKKLEDFSFRLTAWHCQRDMTRELCTQRGIEFIDQPREICDADGFRLLHFSAMDPFHGNVEYGQRMILRLLEVAASAAPEKPASGGGASRSVGSQPYATLPDRCFWRESISTIPAAEVDPVSDPPFLISPGDRVATAGSCFAQHISKRLQSSGFHFMMLEFSLPERESGVTREGPIFSARYGNIYTARQLLQLFDRAFGFFQPVDDVWERLGGGYCDPFRPRIQPAGFLSKEQLLEDRERHLASVRRMFQELDVFVFTLGLTEAWHSRLDGAVYPMAPGVAGGIFDLAKHAFVNFSAQEVVADLDAFIRRLKLVNPRARLVLTVSPVPLVATATGGHVLQATVYSKSVLRVAAEEICRAYADVCYFPSYEIITGPHAANGYFNADRRSISEAGIDHVMRVFMTRMTTQIDPNDQTQKSLALGGSEDEMAEMEAISDRFCDEEMLANSRA